MVKTNSKKGYLVRKAQETVSKKEIENYLGGVKNV